MLQSAVSSLQGVLSMIATAHGVRLERVAQKICVRLWTGGTVYCIGNGGSAAQASHAAAELIGRMKAERPPIKAVALTDPAVLTCIANDYNGDMLFPRQVSALVGKKDILLAFSTSGASLNIVLSATIARAAGCYVVGFTGQNGMLSPCDEIFAVPSADTARIQEVHCLLVHCLVEEIERCLTS